MKLLPVRRNTFHRFLSKLFIQPMKIFKFVKDNIQCPPVHDFTKRMLKKCKVQQITLGKFRWHMQLGKP